MMRWILSVIIILGVIGALIVASPRKDSINNNHQSVPMILTSPSFQEGESIPSKFTCDGGDINPELWIQNVPDEAKSLALIVDDTDATRGGTFTHWLAWNIDPKAALVKQESVPPESVEGINDFGKAGYGGPCPPPGASPHHYHFKLYALSAMLNISPESKKSALEAEIKKYLIAQTELGGIYQRK